MQYKKSNKKNIETDNIPSKESSEPYQTIQQNQSQINKIQIANIILSKRKEKLTSQCITIDNKQSILQTFRFNGSTTKTQNKMKTTQKTQMEQTTLTSIILADDNELCEDRM